MIALIGFMGSGKSTLAKRLADHLQVPVYETDQLVYELTGTNNMNEVFQKGGENLLRQMEQQALERIQHDTSIIDCGGGLITVQANRKLLKELCQQIIFLDAPFSLIKQRVGGESNRPLFTDEAQAKSLYENRISQYKSVATDTIKVNNQSVDELTAQIMEIIR